MDTQTIADPVAEYNHRLARRKAQALDALAALFSPDSPACADVPRLRETRLAAAAVLHAPCMHPSPGATPERPAQSARTGAPVTPAPQSLAAPAVPPLRAPAEPAPHPRPPATSPVATPIDTLLDTPALEPLLPPPAPSRSAAGMLAALAGSVARAPAPASRGRNGVSHGGPPAPAPGLSPSSRNPGVPQVPCRS